MITEEIDLGLMIKMADCQAAIFYDPIRHVAANVHCGWRGSVVNIYQKTVQALKAHFGSQPEDIHVGISPSLGPQVAEFIHYKEELPPPFWDFQVKPFHFDFWQISEQQLLQAGLLPHHIEMARICTKSNPQDWFSYRFNPLCGHNAAFIALL